VEQPVKIGVTAAGERAGAAVGDRIDQVQDLAPIDLGNAVLALCRQHFKLARHRHGA
jgi:hypothetical protein